MKILKSQLKKIIREVVEECDDVEEGSLIPIIEDEVEECDNLEEKAPPGKEKTVIALKKKFPKGSASPFKIAWAQYNKEK